FLCTQNVDDLHEKAGSRRVVHMHGELAVTRCHHCQALKPDMAPLTAGAVCEACGQADGARPHVVWFGEMPLFLDEIDAALSRADLFVSIGTSGAVYPAAGFVAEARAMGVATCEINLEPSANAYMFDEKLYGPASELVPAWVERVLRGL
ncbi:MAG: NAD-dependent protein deacylase, partial [Caulobacter sp.]|nr:NAD-dependent protein deacylase [Caulobacter sp.]